jgi:hypothetical protein
MKHSRSHVWFCVCVCVCVCLCACTHTCVHAFCKCVLEFHQFVRYINYISSHHAVVQFDVSY